VTLVPSTKGSSSSNFWRFEKDFQANGATGAFLAIGTIATNDRIPSTASTANVKINQFNFIRNTAKGGDSQGNGGGGLGAGAGVLLMDGVHLTLRNCIFQDLLAVGGSTSFDYSLGGRGGRGGENTLRLSYSREISPEDSLNGSTGGKFSSFAIAPPLQVATTNGYLLANGLGGLRGPRGTRNKKNLLNGTNGWRGLDGAFGQGGGGGGGGGAIYNDGWTKVLVGNGGRGGNGANGGFGAGGGKSGGGGGGAK